MKYNKDEIKNQLELEDIEKLMNEFNAEPIRKDGIIVSRTICHNPGCNGSHKLYYYSNTHLFQCYTDCGDTFDIFDLVKRYMNSIGLYKTFYTREGFQTNREWNLVDAIDFVAKYFHIFTSDSNDDSFQTKEMDDWNVLRKYENINNYNIEVKDNQLKIFDKKILKFLPQPLILDWAKDGISREIMNLRHICYDPSGHNVIIPHYDKDDNLIGIRARTLIEENEKYGKYLPATLNGKMYNHPLGFSLYNLNNSKNNISILKTAILFESEKSCLQYATMFGAENDISVACCGSSLTAFQFELLLNLGIQELIIGFDKQFQELGDEEWKRWTKKLTQINNKYSKYVKISFLFDKENLLDYKDSPTDKNKKIFLELFNNRIIL